MKNGVWVSWPGGIGWPTPIPLGGGKRKTRKNRKNTRKNRKANRKNRRNTRRS